MRRIKRVFSTADQVIHLWANQTQSDARCRNAFFEGRNVYSYGRHYLLGRIDEFKGVKIAFINCDGYSHTTSGHISSARYACAHMITLDLEDFDWSWDTERLVRHALLRQQSMLVDRLTSHFNTRAGKHDRHPMIWSLDYGSPREAIEEFNAKCVKLKMKEYTLNVDQTYIELYDDHARAIFIRKQELDAKRNSPEEIARKQREQERKEAHALAAAALEVETWRAGGLATHAVQALNPQLIRVRGEVVQTSRGAEVPLTHALRLLRLVNRNAVKPGDRVGHFMVDAVQGDLLKIGCHYISINEARTVLANVTPRLTLVGEA